MRPQRRHLNRLIGLFLGLTVVCVAAEAQRPFATLDPFYQEETARRGFYDGFAAQADLAYRGGEPAVSSGAAVFPLALALRFDYALARQIDVAAVVDMSPGISGASSRTPVRVSWLIVKPYWHHGNTDYAVRLAVDPSSDGGLGFRQTDVAFLSTSDLSPTLSTDFAMGLRRARVGFERLEFLTQGGLSAHQTSLPEIVRSRASGTEIHMMWGYRYRLDPAGSHVFTTISGEGMAYTVLAIRPPQADDDPRNTAAPTEASDEGRLRGGLGRLNVGVEYSRPSFLIAPYVSLPIFRWVELEGDSRTWGPRLDHSRLGLRFTIR